MLIAYLGMVPTHTTSMIRTKVAKIYISTIRLHLSSSICIHSSVNTFWDMLSTIRIIPQGSPLIRKYTKQLYAFKDAECILMFLSTMPRGVSVAHIYVLKLLLHHL